jgi:uncharacterized protein (DUF1501 family)
MAVNRRIFMRGGAMAVIGSAMIPTLFTRAVLAQTEGLRRGGRRLVVVFQRGAADGLNIVVPYREPSYYQMRSSIAVPEGQLLDLDGFFGFHPAMAALKPAWDAKELAIVHACGSPDPTRSHFDAQDYMESGTPGVKSTTDGWLNRALTESPAPEPTSAFRAISMGTELPRTLQGKQPAIAIGNVQTFGVHDAMYDPSPNHRMQGAHPTTIPASLPRPGVQQSAAPDGFASMYADSVNAVLHGTGTETFEAIRMLRSASSQSYTPANGAIYANNGFGDSMKGVAQLMKANLGVEVAFAELGGWDTHQNQGGVNGQLANRLREWSGGLAAFHQDMGSAGQDVVVVTMSEFGRTVRQNGTGGTDHGHANVMLVMGAPVRGGKVYGKWPGLAPGQLNEDRDLMVTTDFRQVLSEAVSATIQPSSLAVIFPGISFVSKPMLGLLKV